MKVTLNVGDKVLLDALSVMISELGHTIVNEDCHVYVTDSKAFGIGQRVIYIGTDGEPKVNAQFIRRPFLKEDLERALSAFSGSDSERGIKVDKKQGAVIFNGEKIMLTEKEMLLFCLLYENSGKAVSDDEILKRVWKNETSENSNIIAVYIKYLRQKLDERVGKRLIFRERGAGYVLKLSEKE